MTESREEEEEAWKSRWEDTFLVKEFPVPVLLLCLFTLLKLVGARWLYIIWFLTALWYKQRDVRVQRREEVHKTRERAAVIQRVQAWGKITWKRSNCIVGWSENAIFYFFSKNSQWVGCSSFIMTPSYSVWNLNCLRKYLQVPLLTSFFIIIISSVIMSFSW